ncbi:hypothetical protein ES703_75391 [subsurface metagenome]
MRMVKDNFTAGLLMYANGVITDNPEGYKAQSESARVAGEPIQTRDRDNLSKALSEQREQALAELVAESDRKAKAEAKAEAKKTKELVEVTS